MRSSMGFADLHSHVLPAIDDGAKGMSESIELLNVLAKMGFDTVCATPHQKVGQFVPTREDIDTAYARVRESLSDLGTPIELLLGAENFWDELFLERSRTKEQPSYTGGKAFLVELNVSYAPPRLEDTLFQQRLAGKLPVLAHPERYAAFWDKNFARYETLSRTVALVVDLGALDGAHGRPQCSHARKLVEEGLAHAAATDVHSIADARSAGAGIQWIRKRCGEAAVQRLLAENPRRILKGELPD
jgi:protein-tyrosine phosphatase